MIQGPIRSIKICIYKSSCYSCANFLPYFSSLLFYTLIANAGQKCPALFAFYTWKNDHDNLHQFSCLWMIHTRALMYIALKNNLSSTEPKSEQLKLIFLRPNNNSNNKSDGNNDFKSTINQFFCCSNTPHMKNIKTYCLWHQC